MNRIKKCLISGIALVLAGSMTLPVLAGQNTSYTRIAAYDLMLESGESSEKTDAGKTLRLEDLKAADPDVQILEQEDQIYLISGTDLPLKAGDAREAMQTAYQLAGMFGCPEEIRLVLFSELKIAENRQIYVFQQVFEGASVPGSTIRLAADRNGQVTAVFNSLFRELPESAGFSEASREDAVNAVQEYLKEHLQDASILPEYTLQVLLPQEDDMENPSDEVLPDLLYWVVYSDNPEDSQNFPYLAHYVSADGKWLYCNAVKAPGDEAARSGFTAAYAFDSMEAATWSGTVTDLNGETKQLTVPVMRDINTGIYYLGDVERRIAVGEYYEFAYEDEVLHLVSSDDNQGWKDDDLLTYANYIRVWDYYADMGWTGPDGCGTPSLLLRNLCLENREPADNAAYLGNFRGWQIFGYDNSTYHFGEALDVMAHEFTHCITGTVQGANLYLNDQGAINESLSDIMGNLSETKLEQKADEEWLMGEDSAVTVRSMMNPHDYDQPEYVWDIYYGPSTIYPNDINDRGGVHINSSILNRLAARLYLEDGISVEELTDFWMTVIFAMTPMTDLPQMADILRWALQECGYSEYKNALEKNISEARMTLTQIPDQLEEGQKLVTLQLPDTPVWNDHHWILQAIQLNDINLWDILLMLPVLLSETAGTEEAAGTEETPGAEGTEELEESVETALMDSHILNTYTAWVSDETRTITAITEDKHSLFLLMNLDPQTLEPKGFAVLFGKRWIDLMGTVEKMDSTGDSTEEVAEEMISNILESGMEIGKELLDSLLGRGSKEKDGAAIEELPTAGLESIELVPENNDEQQISPDIGT